MRVRRSAVAALATFVYLVCTSVTIHAAPAAPAPALRAKSTFYRDVRAKQYAAAIIVGERYTKAHPDDETFALDYAYALLAAHETTEAARVLGRLTRAHRSAVRTAARRQLAALAAPSNVAAGVPAPSPSAPPFTNAYELLAGGDLAAARDAFEATLKTYPDDAPAWRQLSYVDFVMKDPRGMIVALDRYIVLKPDDDRAKLERAYAYLGLGERARADAALAELTRSANADVAAAAKNQLAQGTGGPGKPAQSDVFGYAENESRFHDTFYGIDARYTIARGRVEPYIGLHFANDAKASSVPATSILSDNVVVVSAGLRARIAPLAYAFIEGGQASSLLTGRAQSDLRYGALLSARLGRGVRASQTQIDASVTHFSRYIDTIAYGNVAHDFYIGSRVVRGLVGTNVALDTSRAFYNNAVEGYGGVQVRASIFTIRLEAVAGTYLGRGINAPVRTYSSIRPLVLFGFSR